MGWRMAGSLGCDDANQRGAATVPAWRWLAIRAATEPASGLALKIRVLPGAKMLTSCEPC
jgi:hypothetical protein